MLLITDGTSFDDKKMHMATTISNVILQDIQVKVLLSQLTTLKFLTWFEATNFYSGHLEQLAIACPNLQHLKLQGNSHCLKSLQGLRSIAWKCQNLQENKLHFWKILSCIKLSHLCVGLCFLRFKAFQKKQGCSCNLRSALCALEVQVHKHSMCSKCGYNSDFVTNDFKHVSHFPMLT